MPNESVAGAASVADQLEQMPQVVPLQRAVARVGAGPAFVLSPVEGPVLSPVEGPVLSPVEGPPR